MSAAAKKSLWGTLPAEIETAMPFDILNEQGKILEKATRGRLVGVVTTKTNANGELIHSFYIQAPLLDSYSYLLLSVVHGATTFPLKVNWNGKKVPVTSMTAFENLLRRIFTNSSTHEVIQSLMSQSNAVAHR